ASPGRAPGLVPSALVIRFSAAGGDGTVGGCASFHWATLARPTCDRPPASCCGWRAGSSARSPSGSSTARSGWAPWRSCPPRSGGASTRGGAGGRPPGRGAGAVVPARVGRAVDGGVAGGDRAGLVRGSALVLAAGLVAAAAGILRH